MSTRSHSADSAAVDYRLLVESIADHALFVLDPNGHVASWCPAAVQLTGYREEDILGHDVSFLGTSTDGPALFERARVAGHGEGWYRRRDGSLRWFHITCTSIHDRAGVVQGFATLLRDATEDHERQHRLQKERDRLRAIFAVLTDAVAACDAMGTFTEMNAAALQLTGASGHVGQSVHDSVARYGIFLPDGVTPFPMAQSTLVRALRGEEPEGVEALVRNAAHPDGMRITATSRPLRDDDGVLIGAVVWTHDITEQRRAEAELRREKTLLQSILDCIDETVNLYDSRGRLLLANPAAERLMGRFPAGTAPDERFERYHIYSIDGSQPLPMNEMPALRALRGEHVVELELLFRSPDHEDGVMLSVNANALRDATGAIVAAVVTSRDIGARKRAEAKLAEQVTLLQMVLDCLAETVVVQNNEGRIVLQNPAALRLIPESRGLNGTLTERAAGFELFHVDGITPLALTETATARALRGESVDDLEYMFRLRGQDAVRYLSANSRPLRDADGRAFGVVVTARDISVRRRADEHNRELMKQLQRSNEELEEFAYVASHDLRAPLRAIDALSQWLEDDLRPHLTGDSAEQMRLLRGRVQRMEKLLEDLLDYSRTTRLRTPASEVDITELVREVADLAGAPVGFSITVGELPRFVTAPLPLKRVLLNLVANAIRHHDRKIGAIHISARRVADYFEFSVADDGPGIPAAFHEKIFQMFQTLRPRDECEASGMGLALVKRIVEQVGGKVDIESTGRGATFRFTWPRHWPSRPS